MLRGEGSVRRRVQRRARSRRGRGGLPGPQKVTGFPVQKVVPGRAAGRTRWATWRAKTRCSRCCKQSLRQIDQARRSLFASART